MGNFDPGESIVKEESRRVAVDRHCSVAARRERIREIELYDAGGSACDEQLGSDP
jgi:hypothetical protein